MIKPKPMVTLTPAELERFNEHIVKTSTCWLWVNARLHGGYGSFTVRRDGRSRSYRAHRVAYWQAKGEVPDGLPLDHICRVRNCVNPDHLRPVTPKINTLIGVGPTAVNARKTHCFRGHEFTPENTMVQRHTGYRHCRTCHKEDKRNHRLRMKARAEEARLERERDWVREVLTDPRFRVGDEVRREELVDVLAARLAGRGSGGDEGAGE